MNIFYLSEDPRECATMMVDRHCAGKMALETAQLLSTAHRVLDGVIYAELSKSNRGIRRWLLNDDREKILYKATHMNHPSAVWCRDNRENYLWLYQHFVALLDEYTHRYGKRHKCEFLKDVLSQPPTRIREGRFFDVTPAMPDEYKAKYSVESYRNYYRHGKKHLHKWTNRPVPYWI